MLSRAKRMITTRKVKIGRNSLELSPNKNESGVVNVKVINDDTKESSTFRVLTMNDVYIPNKENR